MNSNLTKSSADNTKVYPLTDSQRGVYFECMERPESTMYNTTFALRLPAGTDTAKFAAAVETAAAASRLLQCRTKGTMRTFTA